MIKESTMNKDVNNPDKKLKYEKPVLVGLNTKGARGGCKVGTSASGSCTAGTIPTRCNLGTVY